MFIYKSIVTYISLQLYNSDYNYKIIVPFLCECNINLTPYNQNK